MISLPDLLAPIQHAVYKLSRQMPSFRWATVTDTAPLRILVDGDDEQLPFTPITLVPCGLGDRVQVQIVNRRLTVVGSGAFASRSIAAGAGLTGGGDLSADRTISVGDGIAPATAAVIPGGANLNLYVAPGYYRQPANANAASGSNYPEPNAGALQVYPTTDDGGVVQVYRSYKSFNLTWQRGLYAGAWSPWALLRTDETRFVTSGLSMSTNTGWKLNNYYARYSRDWIDLQVSVTRTGGNITPSSAGNFTDVPVIYLDPSLKSATSLNQAWPLMMLYPGTSQFFGRIDANSRQVTMTHGIPGVPLNTGQSLSVVGTYPRDPSITP